MIYTIDKSSGDCIDIDVKPGVEKKFSRRILVTSVVMQRAYARLHQTRTGFPTPVYASSEAKRNLVTSRQRQVINYLQTDGQTSLTTVSRPSMK